MSASACHHFDTCSAPLCPENPASLEEAIWYPGEPVCGGSPETWVLQQRKISRRLGKTLDAGHFTVAMLRHPFRVTRALKGLDGEREITPKKIEAWKAKHRAITPEERARMKARLPQGVRFKSPSLAPGGQSVPCPQALEAKTVSEVGGGAF